MSKKYKNPYDISTMMTAPTTPALGDIVDKQEPALSEMLPSHVTERTKQEVQENLKIGRSLWEELDSAIKTRNTITAHEFSRFAPLYKSSVADTGLTMDQFERLSTEYKNRFDPYSPIRIVDAGGALITEIYPRLRQLNAISTDKNKSHLRFHQDGTDKLEIYAKSAKDTLLSSILQEQNFGSVSNEQVESTKSLIDVISKSRGPITKLTINGQEISHKTEFEQEIKTAPIGTPLSSMLDEVEADPD